MKSENTNLVVAIQVMNSQRRIQKHSKTYGRKTPTYIPKSLPLAIHKISILNEPVVVHGKSTQTSKKLSLYPQGSL
jgi:hypothetical protein